MKQSGPKNKGIDNLPASLEELKALRLAQRATNRRVEELKEKLFRITEQHMEQTVSIIRNWMKPAKK
ncbi:MAG: flagellar M-ring protein FliF [Desulfovibrio sp.]|nr:flagellar M-ring protein FliF [Desulfovibrio sp.]